MTKLSFNIQSYSAEQRPALIEFWNATFSECANFVALTEDWWQQRVESWRNPMEPFDPDCLLLARDDKQVIGMIHVGRRPEALAEVCYPGWPGGSQGYVAMLATLPQFRRRGVATRLWQEAMYLLPTETPVVLDGQCFNPFYGNSVYPCTPFWGTPEGISIRWDDEGSRAFFHKQGHGPRFKGVTLEANLRALPPLSLAPLPDSITLEIRDNLKVEVDLPFSLAMPEPRGDFQTVMMLENNGNESIIAGYLTGYRMSELDEGLAAIYEMHLSERWQGRGLGGQVLKSFFSEVKRQGVRRVQTITVPNLSPNAVSFYTRHGFTVSQEWAIF